jgi:predicted HicB family RNase H-like nuclease
MRDRDRYLKIVEWSDDDTCYVGSVPGWIGQCCHGNDEEDVYRQLCRIVDEWIDIYNQDKRPLPPSTIDKSYSGKFQLRTGSDLHKALSIKALLAGDSLNNFCVRVLRKAVARTGKTRSTTRH